MCALATKLCAHLNYESPGTVEILFDDDKKKFYFMEVNTGLQVEHGVTELVSKDGIDIVEWMIRQGHTSTKVDLKSFYWATRGSAIQLRVCAEDPLRDFKPSPGTLSQSDLPVGTAGSGFDAWCFRGCNVTPSYDPLIVKILQCASNCRSIWNLGFGICGNIFSAPISIDSALARFMVFSYTKMVLTVFWQHHERDGEK